MKNLTDFRKTVETGVYPRLSRHTNQKPRKCIFVHFLSVYSSHEPGEKIGLLPHPPLNFQNLRYSN